MIKSILFLVTVFFFLLTGCEEVPEPSMHTISVAVDQTEASGFQLSSALILDPLRKTDLNDGMVLSLIPIADTRYHSKQSFVLEKGATGWMANENLRRNERKLLFKHFQDSLAVLNTNSKELPYSNIYSVVATELNVLASKTGNRELIICSDLKEHSSLFSVYDTRQLRLLYRNSKEVSKIFESSVILADDLSGISVRIVYAPALEDEKLFSNLVALYKSILEPRGALVLVGHHNTLSI